MENPGHHQARCHIENIARELTLEGAMHGSRIEALITSCLEILSTQLYAKSTHFLLEVIQNADDNVYDCDKPTLSFTYKPGSLRIDCNEIGLTQANVEALCAVNRSTKSGKTRHGEHIGEKGIGFKSVFKAADVVWISSRHYSFKFDRTKSPLGMITPVWADFPEPTTPGCTSMYLQLSKGWDENTLVQDLLCFDTNLLIFLRRVEQIALRVLRSDQEQQSWEKTLRKTEEPQGDERLVTLHDGANTFGYNIRSHVVRDLPPEQKRPNWPETRILLAFPAVDAAQEPQLPLQNVYAFLPIRNYGFNFLLQGDFLLTASREDIEGTLAWNIKLRQAVAEAFLTSVHHFNKGDLKYIWPYYLPLSSTAACTFFQPAVETILMRLRETDVLESCAGIICKPWQLQRVPLDQFADQSGIPFTLGRHTEARYLSLKYPRWAAEATSSIGVSELSPQQFLRDLASLIADDAEAFQAKPAAWHSQLAAALVKLGTDSAFTELIEDMPLIPLQDGSWTSARGQCIFFSKAESTLEVPGGVEVLVVDATADSDANRHKLYGCLGAKAWEASEICRLVLRVHASTDFEPESLTTSQLVSHAVFLWKASWQPPKETDIWFATTRGGVCKGRRLYIPGSCAANSATGRIFARLRDEFDVIHGDYLAAAQDADWVEWLVRNLGLSRVPRIVAPEVEPALQPVEVQDVRSEGGPDNAGEGKPDTAGNSSEGRLNTAGHSSEVELNTPGNSSDLELNTAGNSSEGKPDTAGKSSEGKLDTAGITASTSMSTGPPLKKRPPGSVGRPLGKPSPGSLGHPPQSSTPPIQLAPLQEQQGGKIIFDLSKEFSFMFHECNTSDVLELLKENWQLYSRWIDGAHMKWQSPDFVTSSARLKKTLGSCIVQSAIGPLPLCETVLPKIDSELDEGGCIPAVDISDPSHHDWRLLAHFGVIINADVHFHLRCLQAMAKDPNPDVDKVAYLYENIQSVYRGNEKHISNAFQSHDIVLTRGLGRPNPSLKRLQWTNMGVCVAMGIDLKPQYPASSYLFRCLASPGGDPVAAKVAAVSCITSSNGLEEISRRLCDLSAVLKDVSATKAAQLLKPLQDRQKTIFPVTHGPGPRRYGKFDELMEAKNSDWYIADQSNLRDSFLGVLPLLALPVEDVASIQELVKVLRLDDRVLSRLVEKSSQARGRISNHRPYTALLQENAPFIKALVSETCPDRPTALHQLEEMRASVATKITVTFTLDLPEKKVEGNAVSGEAMITKNGRLVGLVLSEECAAADAPPYALVKLMADTFHVDEKHFSLLHIAMSDMSVESIFSTFTQHGIFVKGLDLGKSKVRRLGKRGALTRITRPSLSKFEFLRRSSKRHGRASTESRADATWYCSSAKARRWGCGELIGGDRRLSMITHLHVDAFSFRGGGSATISARMFPTDTDVARQVHYLGAHMLSKLFEVHLGDAYNPERDWTSLLRVRSGYKPHIMSSGNPTSADFTLRDLGTRENMARFLLEHGRSNTPGWENHLRGNSAVYHIDVAVTSGSKYSKFTISSCTLERMRKFRIREGYTTRASKHVSDISVLVRISDAYSDSQASFGIFVDPWPLFAAGELMLSDGWLLQGQSQEAVDTGAGRRKRYKKSTPLLAPWASQPNIPDSSSDKPVYSYKPLGSGAIRLLHLLPGENKDQDLQGVMIHVPTLHSSDHHYQALSYVWGADTRTEELLTPDGIIRITPSLSAALRHLRQRTTPLVLWVDAVCINQSDSTEKAEQIRLLPRIFQDADFTYAFWTGADPEGNSDAVMQMLAQVRGQARRQERELGSGNKGGDSSSEDESSDLDEEEQVPSSWRNRSIPMPDDPVWPHVEALFSSPWFRRAWILQETVASADLRVVCGNLLVNWDELQVAVEIVHSEAQDSEHEMMVRVRTKLEPFMALSTQREWEGRQYRWALITLLEQFRHLETTLQRDRFFALLGLSSDANEPEFEPDYVSPLEDVVLRFARVFLRQGRGMQLLHRAGLGTQSHRFPSWIPDWTKPMPESLHESEQRATAFNACGAQDPQIQGSMDANELVVGGYDVDVVERVSFASNTEGEWKVYLDEVDTMIDEAALAVVSDERADLKWKVPIAGVDYPKFNTPGSLDLKPAYEALRELLEVEANSSGGSTGGDDPLAVYRASLAQAAVGSLRKQSASYTSVLKETVAGWRFFVTKRGYVGVAPGLVKVDDTVAVMKGGKVPFILCKSEERGGRFRLIGECYVHGLMHGECLFLDDVVERDFWLH